MMDIISCIVMSLLIMMVADGFTVHGPSGPVVAPLGSSVVLPCYVDGLSLMEDLQVEWRRTDSETVVQLFLDGESRPESQHEGYRDRAHFFTDQIQHGNVSLRLDNLKAEDEGGYRCTVYSQHDYGETVVQIKAHARLLVSGSDRSVSANDGEDVTLNCSVDSHIPLEHIDEVSWIRTDEDGDIPVLLFQNNKILSYSSDEQYRGRVEFFTAEIPKLNFSLRLKSVRTEDRGVYMCQVFAGGLSASATVVLEQLGFSSWHIAVLFFCSAAGSGAVLLLFSLVYCRSNNTVFTSNTIWILQVSLVFCPNICMFLAFMLWGFTEGSLNETITCCALYILRPVMLIWAMHYLKYLQDNLKTWITFFNITREFAVFTVVVYSVIFTYGWRKSAHDNSIVPRVVSGICFGAVVLSCLILSRVLRHRWVTLSWIITITLLEIILLIFFLLNMLDREKEYLGSTCVIISLEVLKMIVIFVEGFINKTWILGCICWMFVLQLFQLIISFRLPSLVFIIVVLVQSLLSKFIPFLPLLQAKLKFLQHRWITSSWIITITLLDIILLIYVLLSILGREKEYLGGICVILFLEVLKMIVIFVEEVERLTPRRGQQTETQHGSNALHLWNEIMYMFGAVALVLLSSVTLTAELILKARNGERVMKDLGVIVFPSECAFALYWMSLQMHAYWKIVITGFAHNQRNSTQRRHLGSASENHELENLSAPNTAVSQKKISETDS